MLEHIIVKRTKTRVYLEADEATLNEFILVLGSLADLLTLARGQARFTQARRERNNTLLQKRRERDKARFDEMVYERYCQHLNNGCAGNSKEAIKKLRVDFGLQAIDVKYILRGHKSRLKLLQHPQEKQTA